MKAKHKGGKHTVHLHTPPIGSELYLAKLGGYGFYEIVAIKNGVDAMTITNLSYESLYSSDTCDCLGNKEVRHYYVEGNIYVLPKTDKGFHVIDTEEHDHGNVYKTRRFLVGNREVFKRGVFSESYTINNTHIVSDSGSAEHHHYQTDNFYGEKHPRSSSEDIYVSKRVFDYKNKITLNSVITSSRSSTTRGYPEYNESSESVDSHYDMDFIYLGQVIGNSSNLPSFEREFAWSIPLPPDTFLADLYAKVGIPHVNNCENLKGLRDYGKMAPPILNIIKKHNIKSVADLYLWWKYSYTTTKLDIKEYIRWFGCLMKSGLETQHFSLTYGDVAPVRYNIYTEPISCGVFRALGLEINYSNTWDMIPFSFVLDWFVSVGDTLNSLDAYNYLSQVKIKSFMQSYKVKRYINLSKGYASSHIDGSVRVSSYLRETASRLPTTVCSLNFNDPSAHLLDGTSLIISSKKRR